MKPLVLPSLAALSLGLIAAGCSSSPLSRIDQNRTRYESWPVAVQEAVLAGEARPGMTLEQVEMALGKPTQVVSRGLKPGEDEVWIYRQGNSVGSSILNAASGVSVGTGIGGVNVGASGGGVSVGSGVGGVNVGTSIGGGRASRRQTPDEREVVFRNGVVVRSDPKP